MTCRLRNEFVVVLKENSLSLNQVAPATSVEYKEYSYTYNCFVNWNAASKSHSIR